ncbi:nodulation protein nodB [Pseudovirgaria hyperparasitica]|uniref:chitin deacetylase n=1 Tax=Pseudovirgaria hyperparasitica TaxID=470096 RepID=A0A6A6W835_9PEZI|nr:nodulation protein nodB [Pseudovirgaria hyperparasitica]KAF2758705.1 nodulation protein nodB [Pseudovirgaria hyperparasitica]
MLLLAIGIIWGVLIPLAYIVYKPPAALIHYFRYHWPDVLWEVSTTQKIVALTIDDAPSEYTSEILDALNNNDATATFFVIGSQVSGRENILRNVIWNDNELGNHAMRDEPSRSLDDGTLVEQIHTVEERINEAYTSAKVPLPPKYFRPGSGFFSSKMRNILKNLDYRLVLGSIYPHDPQIPYSHVNAKHILSMLRPGAIIICHDRRSWTAPMLREILPEIKRQGYKVVTVTTLLQRTGIS